MHVRNGRAPEQVILTFERRRIAVAGQLERRVTSRRATARYRSCARLRRANAVLSFAIPLQLFESITGGIRSAAQRYFCCVWTAGDVRVALLHTGEDTDSIV